MRTTIRLDEALLRRAKDRAAKTGRTLTAVIEDGLRLVLARPIRRGPADGWELPVSGTGGTWPGVNLDSSADLEDMLNRPEP